MTLQELSNAIGAIIPNAEIGDDLDGQIVIYTGLKFANDIGGDDTLTEFED